MLCVFLFCSILFGCHKFFPSFPAFDILKFLLIVLLILHTVWTYFILKILHRAVIAGKTEKDSRSSSSEISSGESSDGTEPIENEQKQNWYFGGTYDIKKKLIFPLVFSLSCLKKKEKS